MKSTNLILPISDITRSPASLAQYCTRWRYSIPPHIEYLDKIILKAANREIKKVIVNMPPRHGKSEYISKYFPFWYLGKFPDHRIILASYAAQFATSWGRRVKELIAEYGEEIFGIKINPKASSASYFELLEYMGGMSASGAGGSLTGKGADLLIIDDPVKNDRDAHSFKIRENVWDWFRSTAYSRLEPDGIIVIVMTRWHEDDLCGRISNQEQSKILDEFEDDDWEVIRFPAFAVESDVLGRQQGDPLWDERYPQRRLLTIKRNVGEYWFASLYQQMPNPAGGGIFKQKDFRYFYQDEYYYYLRRGGADSYDLITYPRSECSIYATVDLACTIKESSDYTAIIVFAVTKNKEILVLEVIRERIEGADHLNVLKQLENKWNPHIIGIESNQYMISLVQTALRQYLKVVPLRADKDKLSRSLPIAAKMQAGLVYFREHSPWLDFFEQELLQFPNGAHDDMVDAFGYVAVVNTADSDMRIITIKAKRYRNGKVTDGFCDGQRFD